MNKANKLVLLKDQLEFYFSCRNLQHDTYLQTLVHRNDGGVPLAIVANFERIRAICLSGNVQQRMEMLQEAIQLSDSLQIIHVDMLGTQRDPNQQGFRGHTVPCVATHNQQPLPDPTLTHIEAPCNVMILRDLPQQTTEDDVRRVFRQLEGDTPKLLQVQQEVANCWYVIFLHSI